jgi:hypothetical protein
MPLSGKRQPPHQAKHEVKSSQKLLDYSCTLLEEEIEYSRVGIKWKHWVVMPYRHCPGIDYHNYTNRLTTISPSLQPAGDGMHVPPLCRDIMPLVLQFHIVVITQDHATIRIYIVDLKWQIITPIPSLALSSSLVNLVFISPLPNLHVNGYRTKIK